jgi:hypothetical protein
MACVDFSTIVYVGGVWGSSEKTSWANAPEPQETLTPHIYSKS